MPITTRIRCFSHHGTAAYLNEYAFRVNRRGTQPAAFQTALGIESRVQGPTGDQLYVDAGEPGGWQHPGLLDEPPPFDHKP